MSIARICQRNVDTDESFESVRAAAQSMSTRSVSRLLVLVTQRRPTGLITDRDIALCCSSEGCNPAVSTVIEVMTPSPRVVSGMSSVEDALTAMRIRGMRYLPVVNPLGELVGVVSLDYALVLLAEELWQMGPVIQRSSPAILATY